MKARAPKKVHSCHFSAAFISLVKDNTSLTYFPGLSLATPFSKICSGLWGYNSSLSCVAIGGMFYAFTWQTHLLAVACGRYPLDFHYCHVSFWSEKRYIYTRGGLKSDGQHYTGKWT